MTEGPEMMFADPLTSYTAWFAWHPIRTWDYRWRWLCWVERRLMHKKPHLDGPICNPWWQHRVAVWRVEPPYPFGNGPFI